MVIFPVILETLDTCNFIHRLTTTYYTRTLYEAQMTGTNVEDCFGFPITHWSRIPLVVGDRLVIPVIYSFSRRSFLHRKQLVVKTQKFYWLLPL
jgi:hypothetical protein